MLKSIKNFIRNLFKFEAVKSRDGWVIFKNKAEYSFLFKTDTKGNYPTDNNLWYCGLLEYWVKPGIDLFDSKEDAVEAIKIEALRRQSDSLITLNNIKNDRL